MLRKNSATTQQRDHGGGLDAAIAQFGGARSDWIDLSTGINPHPYPFTKPDAQAWTQLPDTCAQDALITAARHFWSVTEGASVLAVPGASAAISQIPRLHPAGTVWIPAPTYNEHAAAFAANGWRVSQDRAQADAQVLVHPNNPTGDYWSSQDLHAAFRVVDESFCDVAPDRTLVHEAARPNTLVLKSFGKFWGLAGIRLGFVIGPSDIVAQLAEMIGPWPVSGVALSVGQEALMDVQWAATMRKRLANEADRLDTIMTAFGADVHGGTTLFRLYRVDDAEAVQTRLAKNHIWSRRFPYAKHWIRLGLPPQEGWTRLEAAL